MKPKPQSRRLLPLTEADTPKQDIAFEDAFARLETLLERMNSGKTSLDESLKLFEEANGLISQCTQRLTHAEKRVETLIRQRGEGFAANADGTLSTEPFNPEGSSPTPPR